MTKVRSDPLLMMRKMEQQSLKSILDNPVQMQSIAQTKLRDLMRAWHEALTGQKKKEKEKEIAALLRVVARDRKTLDHLRSALMGDPRLCFLAKDQQPPAPAAATQTGPVQQQPTLRPQSRDSDTSSDHGKHHHKHKHHHKDKDDKEKDSGKHKHKHKDKGKDKDKDHKHHHKDKDDKEKDSGKHKHKHKDKGRGKDKDKDHKHRHHDDPSPAAASACATAEPISLSEKRKTYGLVASGQSGVRRTADDVANLSSSVSAEQAEPPHKRARQMTAAEREAALKQMEEDARVHKERRLARCRRQDHEDAQATAKSADEDRPEFLFKVGREAFAGVSVSERIHSTQGRRSTRTLSETAGIFK
eukprot:TRINITY_DN922_c0_g1_i4.p1 TRINITY_DN922_c0_g1~~TRINITY_DN922_c0_g1_i4.p1  ORF type:complete len:359 (+),score=127.45 TRINITY_DN922_c0_g1_i4:384-1460(+)